jgi:hypothetical protein
MLTTSNVAEASVLDMPTACEEAPVSPPASPRPNVELANQHESGGPSESDADAVSKDEGEHELLLVEQTASTALHANPPAQQSTLQQQLWRHVAALGRYVGGRVCHRDFVAEKGGS